MKCQFELKYKCKRKKLELYLETSGALTIEGLEEVNVDKGVLNHFSGHGREGFLKINSFSLIITLSR